MLVADALRLGGAILGPYPDMLAPQLVGRLLPEAQQNPAVSSLLQQCHDKGKNHCALLPSHHCLHTPGGPLKVNRKKFLRFLVVIFILGLMTGYVFFIIVVLLISVFNSSSKYLKFMLSISLTVFLGRTSVRRFCISSELRQTICRIHIKQSNILGSIYFGPR